MIKVGAEHEGKKGFKYTYKEVKYLDGWADAELFLPNNFDLVFLKLEEGKTRSGWHTGMGWDGLKLQPTDKVQYWKKKDEE